MGGTAEKITRYYGGDWHGNYGSIPTPGHGKSDRGTTVRDGENGDVVIHTFNGRDDTWRELKADCRRRGLLPERHRANDNGAAWQDTAAFEYVDRDGTVAYRTLRKEKAGERKRFVAQRPDGRGGWTNGLGELYRIPYRLPDIIAADPSAIVYLTEGERKADKLASWGLVATAVAFGAQGWRDSYAAALDGRTVAILPDNDDQGRRFAEQAAKSIDGAGGRAVIVQIPGLPPKGDVIDWTGDVAELRTLTEAALNPPVAMLPLLDPGSWQGLHPPARQWALNEWIPARQATYLTGAGSTGKSLLAQQLATCIAIGRPFLGIETRHTEAIYLTCEDDADELQRRQIDICAAMGIELSALSGKLHLVSLAGVIGNELATFDVMGRMATSSAWHTLVATVKATGARFIALDNVAHLFAGNENIRNQVAAFCGLLNGLAAEADASVLFIGHPNKAGDSFSGSTAWENQVRSRIFLDRPREADGSVIDPDARTLARAKANYARNGEAVAFRWHQWAFVRDEDLPPDVGAQMSEAIAAAHENAVFLACLAERTRQRRPVSERSGRNLATVVFSTMPESKGLAKTRLEAAMDRLFRLGTIERGFLWRDKAEGRDVTGLRLSEKGCGVSANGSANDPQTRSANDRNHYPQTTVDTHTPPKGGGGRGHGWPPALHQSRRPRLARRP